MSRGLVVLLLVLGALVLAWELPFARNGCVIRNLSGACCPGCGGTRAVSLLLEGRWAEAAQSNLLVYPVAAGVLWSGVALVANRWGGRRWPLPLSVSRRGMWGLLAIVAAFTLLRNLPWAEFLRP
ncbi:DUF2752 domain-containing protein [Haloferula sp. BvORR071]|uniref:DUF2752 domain-containing protein n=1 Tax=Haloferula sp. BvORR071 TaxID=1396141 RepID=UPI00069816C9|nr:DUF2752 domain-containing protein [Haloferula sp. BvORR071]